MEDIETILNTLIYDGKVEMTIIAAKEGTVGCVDGQMKLYRGVNSIIQPTGLVKTPCGLCPVNAALTLTASKYPETINIPFQESRSNAVIQKRLQFPIRNPRLLPGVRNYPRTVLYTS